MPIQPRLFKYVCSKCGYEKVVKPKSDALNISHILSSCPKCKNSVIEKKELNTFDNIKGIFS